MSLRKIFIMLIGCPSSGKSFVREKVINHIMPNIEVLSPDDEREVILDSKNTGIYHDLSKEKEVWGIVKEQRDNLIEKGVNIIFDATNTIFKSRMQFIDPVKKKGYEIIYIFCNLPLDEIVLLQRGRERKVPYWYIAEKFVECQSPKVWREKISPLEYDQMIEFTSKNDQAEYFITWYSENHTKGKCPICSKPNDFDHESHKAMDCFIAYFKWRQDQNKYMCLFCQKDINLRNVSSKGFYCLHCNRALEFKEVKKVETN